MKCIGHLFLWFTTCNCWIVFTHQSCTHNSCHEPSLAAIIGPHHGTSVRACERFDSYVREINADPHHELASTLHTGTGIGWDWFWGTPACSTCSAWFPGENLYYTAGMILCSGISTLLKPILPHPVYKLFKMIFRDVTVIWFLLSFFFSSVTIMAYSRSISRIYVYHGQWIIYTKEDKIHFRQTQFRTRQCELLNSWKQQTRVSEGGRDIYWVEIVMPPTSLHCHSNVGMRVLRKTCLNEDHQVWPALSPLFGL